MSKSSIREMPLGLFMKVVLIQFECVKIIRIELAWIRFEQTLGGFYEFVA